MARPASTQTPVIWNAVFQGLLAGAVVNAVPAPAPTAAQIASAQAIASAVDTTLGIDATLASAAGVTALPTTAAIANALATKPALMFGICLAAGFQRVNVDPVAADSAAVQASIVAQYNAAIAANAIT